MALCLCGCKKEARKNRKYIHGHNGRGKPQPKSEDTRNKLRRIIKELYESDPSYRERVSLGTRKSMNKEDVKEKLKNRIVTGETRRKISDRTKIAMNRDGVKEKVSKASKEMWSREGFRENYEKIIRKIRNKEWRDRISASRKGKCLGEENPNWKDGRSFAEYCQEWRDKEYKDSIKSDRDKNRCQNPFCAGRSYRIDLHHINYIKKDCRPSNLITLCRSCHSITNWHRTVWQEFFYKKINGGRIK